MNRKYLYAVLALALGAASSAQANDWDGRWYFAPYMGVSSNDDSRDTDATSLMGGMGFGKYINPNTTIDVFVDRVHRTRDLPFTSGWNNLNIGAAARFYFGDSDSWQPFVMAGVAANNHRASGKAPGVSDNDSRQSYGWAPAIQVGVGLAKSYNDDIKFRAELGYRYDYDDDSKLSEENYGDVMLNVGLMFALGGADAAPPPTPAPDAGTAPAQPGQPGQPAAAAKSCRELDDDKDGVNNCDDKCPGTARGVIVGPDGCEQKITIDLRGVNFKFDYPKKGETDISRAGLTEGSMALLDQAVDVLKRYPNIRVEVAGHTDAVGTDEYNQGLSERRSRIVYDYLTSHGIDGSRLAGPNGYGEGKPIDTNDTKEGRARNRRTELNVQ